MPITSRDLMKPNKVCFLESNSIWYDYEVQHPALLIPFGASHTVFYNPLRPPGPDAITLKEYYNDLIGVVYLPTPGRWWFNLPLAGSVAAQVCFRVIDCASPESAQVLIRLLTANSENINVAYWGGAALGAGVAWNTTTAQDERVTAALVRAAVAGVDSSQAAGSMNQAVEARTGSANPVNALYRLLTSASLAAVDLSANDYRRLSAVKEHTLAGAYSALCVYESKKAGFVSSRYGRRFTVKSPNITGVAAATALTTTAPTYMLVNGATNEAVIRRICVTLDAIGTSTGFKVLVKTDTADRFSSGGTTRTPVTMNNGNAVAATQARSLEAPTATAEGGGTRDVDVKSTAFTAAATFVQGTIEFLFEDGLIIAAGGSLLVYAVTPTNGATVHYVIEYEDADVQ